MVQATNGLMVPSVEEGKATTCVVCDKPMNFKETPKGQDSSLYGLARAEHCGRQYVINAYGGYRIDEAPAPEEGPYPPRGSKRSNEIDKEKERRAKIARGETVESESESESGTGAGAGAGKSQSQLERESALAEKARRDAEEVSEEAKDAKTRGAAKRTLGRLEE